MMHEFNEQRPYDLIILQYGLNVATERGRNYDKYIAGMQTTIDHLKDAFPQAGILIVSVGDRDYKTEDGTLRTMPGIKIWCVTNKIWRRITTLLSGICSKQWEEREAWRIWYMPSLLWRIMTIRILISGEVSTWQAYFMKRLCTERNSTTGGGLMKRNNVNRVLLNDF